MDANIRVVGGDDEEPDQDQEAALQQQSKSNETEALLKRLQDITDASEQKPSNSDKKSKRLRKGSKSRHSRSGSGRK